MHDTYMSLLAHRYLCGKAFIYGPVMHCTHVYAWNLLTRPETTSHVKWSHLTVVEDHISVTINKHKADHSGRVLTGGNLHRTSFAALPPHFRNDFVITDEEWISIFPVYDKLKSVCPTFISCLSFLLASGVYH